MNAKLFTIFLVAISVAWGFSSEAFACRGWWFRTRVSYVRYCARATPMAQNPASEPVLPGQNPGQKTESEPGEVPSTAQSGPQLTEAPSETGGEKPGPTGAGTSPEGPTTSGPEAITSESAAVDSPQGEAACITSGHSSENGTGSESTSITFAPNSRCDTQRKEITSGARVTLYANFLRREAGVVMFEIGGTSWECELIEWQPDSVTVDLPRLGLAEPKNADITIVLPDGRIAKTFKVRYVPQPNIVRHEEWIPQPMPPVPAMAAPANHVVTVQGGFTLYGN